MKIKNTADLKNLCEASKYISKVATPGLYESVIIDTTIGSLRELRYMVNGLPLKQIKRYTKHIWIKDPFYEALRKSCTHYAVNGRQALRRDDDLFCIISDLHKVLLSLNENHLLSFR